VSGIVIVRQLPHEPALLSYSTPPPDLQCQHQRVPSSSSFPAAKAFLSWRCAGFPCISQLLKRTMVLKITNGCNLRQPASRAVATFEIPQPRNIRQCGSCQAMKSDGRSASTQKIPMGSSMAPGHRKSLGQFIFLFVS